ncbi:MAG: hypothetical protein NTW04_01815, partial [Elusimicrobia bacterium]|nr:hypothetical protein [Elusimicrobiota bacterium]
QYLNAIVLSASEKVFLKIRFDATSRQVSAINFQLVKFYKLPFSYPYFHPCINSNARILKTFEIWMKS